VETELAYVDALFDCGVTYGRAMLPSAITLPIAYLAALSTAASPTAAPCCPLRTRCPVTAIVSFCLSRCDRHLPFFAPAAPA
jgi:hypothetical protein